MKSLTAVIVAATYGLTLRIVFGFLANVMAIMSMALLILAPVVIGFLTVILIGRKNKITGVSAFFLPWATIFILLIVTMVLSMEGAICWIMIYPLAAILAGLGGMIAYSFTSKSSDNTYNTNGLDNDEFGSIKVSVVLLLPLFIGMLEGEQALASKEISIKREIVIPASGKIVWKELMNINEIDPKDKTTYLANFLGFPKHLRTTLDTAAVGGKRVAYYENGLYFEEEIAEYVAEERIVLNLNIDPSKIPSYVMDEHIIIGGKHVDILQDTYTLKKLSDQRSLLTLTSHLIIKTPFNWYASIWSELLMADILEGELNLIKRRATASL